jgi:hypothetical protein
LSDSIGTVLGRIGDIGLRRFAAVYVLAFLAAVTLAPHRHLNSFEDLVSDGPSDSGIVLEASRPQDPMAGPRWSSARFTDDDPCLACFHNDWATEAIAFLVLAPRFSPTTLTRTLHDPLIPAPRAGARHSRAPPALA